MFRNGIYFSDVRKEVFTVTWPKKNGEFDPAGRLESAVINPHRFIDGVEFHFKGYLKELRAIKPTAAKDTFLAAVNLKWKLGEPGPVIGMTEEEFLSEA